jgi:MYXO-CTERM domain-containing protein
MKYSSSVATIFFSCVAALVVSFSAQAQSQYMIYDIGTLGGGYSTGYGINNAGQITGSSVTAGLESHPFVYTFGGSMQDLGNFSVGGYTEGYAINSSAQVVGASYDSTFTIQSGFRNTSGSYLNLGTLGGSYTAGNAINDNGQVAGTAYKTGDNLFSAFRYSGNTMTEIVNTLGGNKSEGRGINSAGDLTGRATLGNGNSVAFIYTTGGGMVNLGTLGGSDSSGGAINDSGAVTGTSGTTGNAAQHAFFYNGVNMVDIGTLGDNSSGNDLNNLGEVVGSSDIGGSNFRAFVYTSGSIYNLNSLAANLGASGFSFLEGASSINDNGWIAGTGVTTGLETHGFLAIPIPVPEPTTTALGLLGLAAAVWHRRSVKR